MSVWQPLTEWLEKRPEDFLYDLDAVEVPGRSMWDPEFTVSNNLATRTPYDPMEPERGFFWNDNQAEISRYWMVYVSRWLRVDQFLEDVNSGTLLCNVGIIIVVCR